MVSNSVRINLQSLMAFLSILVLTGYVFLNAHLDDSTGDSLLPILLFLSMCSTFLGEELNSLPKGIVVFFFVYFVLALLSFILPGNDFAYYKWLKACMFRFSVILILLNGFYYLKATHFRVIRYPLVIFIAIFLVINLLYLELGAQYKMMFDFITPLPLIDHVWNRKYVDHWIVLLTLGGIACVYGKSRYHKILMGMFLSLVGWTVFSQAFLGPKVALMTGGAVFLLQSFFPLNRNYWLYLIVSLSAFIVPVTVLLYFLSNPIFEYQLDENMERTHVNNSISSRHMFYRYSAELIRQKPITGHGFGSAQTLPFPYAKQFSKYYPDRLPGGHPHNVVYLFIIEHGLIGLGLLISATIYFYNYLFKHSKKYKKSGFILSIFLSFQTIFSFSYDIWRTDCIYLILLFLMMIKICFIGSEINSDPDQVEYYAETNAL